MLVSIALVSIASCRGERAPAHAPPDPEDLAGYLSGVAGAPDATRRDEIAGWMLDEPAWRRIVVDPYRALWPDYARRFAAAAAPLVERLSTPGAITARRHFAGDPRLTLTQARLRWAVPVLYPSAVAELAGAPIDAVFVHDGVQWRALVGLDAIVLDRVRALDAACGETLARAGPLGRCTEVGWAIAEAALRGDAHAFAHACQLAAPHCANARP
jgi:hypothetical protein